MTISHGIDVALTNGTHKELPNDALGDYQIREVPMGTKRKLKIIFMGMGPSGINFAYQLFQRMTDIDLVVYEKNVTTNGHDLVYPC
jgi:hypothetical protein